jgi:hypothetical protein
MVRANAREAVDSFIQVRAAWRCVIPYVLMRVLYVVGYKEALWCWKRRGPGGWLSSDVSLFERVPPRPYILDRGVLHAITTCA